jgi:queuosine precursor transporter
MNNQNLTRYAVISSSCYVSFQIIANILSSKITILPLTSLAIDGGTIIYPLTFTLRDFVHKTIGKKESRVIVILAASINLVMVGLFWIIGKMPADPSWNYQDAYDAILLPVWRITIGSIIAQVISELIDTEIFSVFYKRFGDVGAVIASNTVALIFDSLIFSAIAFLGVLPLQVVFQIIIANIAVKFVVSMISSPFIKLIPRIVSVDKI